MLLDFVKNHEAAAIILDRIEAEVLDFDAVLTAEQQQAAHEEASQLELDELTTQLLNIQHNLNSA